MSGPAALLSQPPLDSLLRMRLPDRGVTEVAAGEALYGPDGTAAELILVEEGLVLVSRAAAVDVRGPRETLGECALGGAARNGESARALVPARVRRWSAAEAAALVASDGEVALAATRMLARRAVAWRERIAACEVEPVPRRLARTLLDLRAKTGARLPSMEPATLSMLAGAAHAVAGVHLAHFMREGLLTRTAAGWIVEPALERWLRDS